MSPKVKRYLYEILSDSLYTVSGAYFLWSSYCNFISQDIFSAFIQLIISVQLLIKYGIRGYFEFLEQRDG